MRTVEAIIFDCFGVLVDSNFNTFCQKYIGDDTTRLAEITILDEQACAGKISHEQLIREVARTCDISIEKAADIISHSPPDVTLFKYIRENLQPNYTLGLLSNASRNWLDELFTADQLSLFKDKLLSFEVGLTKPDAKIFELAAKRLGVTQSGCILIDDSMKNCKEAVAAGMQAVHYETFEQFKRDISGLLS